jgi:hypothetical protein
MTDVGKPVREYEVDPIDDPVPTPREQPAEPDEAPVAPVEAPVAPVEAPELVPA